MNNTLKIVGIVVLAALVGGLVAYWASLGVPTGDGIGAAGDTASTSRTAVIAAQTATTTWCALYNYGSRDRLITKWIVFDNATSTNGDTNILAGTSTVATGAAIGVNAMMNGIMQGDVEQALVGLATGTAASSYGAFQTLSTSSAHLLRWKTATYLKFVASSSLNTTENATNWCGVDYIVAH